MAVVIGKKILILSLKVQPLKKKTKRIRAVPEQNRSRIRASTSYSDTANARDLRVMLRKQRKIVVYDHDRMRRCL